MNAREAVNKSRTMLATEAPTGDRIAALEHLSALWPNGLPAGGLVTIWSRHGKKTQQFESLEEAAAFATAQPERYLVTSAVAPVKKGRRGGARDVVAVPGLALDLDIRGGAHKRTDLPDREQALAILRDLPIAPSLLLESGGGFYALWLFETPWLLTDEQERASASAISKGWQAFIREQASRLGVGIDETSDLSRCLRCAGALNAKYTPPRLVRRVEPTSGQPITRYDPANFGSYAAPTASATKVPRSSAQRPFSNPVSESAGEVDWLKRAGAALGGVIRSFVDEHGGGVVVQTCPSCHGRETGGTIATGTAHICRTSGTLRCKRASCEAREAGLPIEVWGARFLGENVAAEVRALRARDHKARLSLSDDGNASRLVRRHGEDLRWSPSIGWLEWDTRRWKAVPTTRAGVADRVIDRARETARVISREAEEEGLDDEKRKEIRRHARKSSDEPSLRRMVALARCDLTVDGQLFDADPWILNTRNGVLDLRTGVLHAHRREDLLSKIADVEYDASARDEDLERLLVQICGGDFALRDYLERLIGYTLVGEKREDKIVLLLGPGGTGKSSLNQALLTLLGDYACTVPFDALLSREHGSGPRPELVRTRGARMVVAGESREGREVDAALLKSIAGGDELNVRDLYHGPLRFRPTFTLWLQANQAPHFRRDDSGLRRRLVVIPFERNVEVVDENLRGRLREPSAQRALLALAVRGSIRWQRDGAMSCRAVADATLRLFEGGLSSDILIRFVEELCEVDGETWTPTSVIRSKLAAFAHAASAHCPTDRALAECLHARGFVDVRHATGRGWRLRLLGAEGAE